MIKVIQMYLKMIKTELKLLLWPLFSLKVILYSYLILKKMNECITDS